ncbi:DUF6893 family small protein [Actinopolyspora mzabensis]
MRRFLFLVLVVGVIATLAWLFGPDVKRYVRISRM